MKLFHFQFPVTHYSGNRCELISIFIRSEKSPSKQQIISALESLIKQAGSENQENQEKEVLNYLKNSDIPVLDGWFVGVSMIIKHPKFGDQNAYLDIVFFYDVETKELQSEIAGKATEQTETIVGVPSRISERIDTTQPFRVQLDLQ